MMKLRIVACGVMKEELLSIAAGDTTDLEFLPQGLQRSLEVARVLGLNHEKTPGDPTYLQKLVFGPWEDEGFINVPAHRMVEGPG